jgi:probable phosphoglycerate mutase
MKGRAQARFLQLQLQSMDFRRVYCSDLRRCRETARIISSRHGLRIRPVRELREIALGDWDGLPVSEVKRRFPGEYERRGRDILDYRPSGGESFLDLQDRVVPAFLDILGRETGNILMIGHAGVNRTILCHLQQQPLEDLFQIPQTYAGVNIIERHGSRSNVRTVNIKPDLTEWEQVLCKRA